ncbi:hypothetical protein Tco_1494104 [Tanacetum coccineum]
MKEIVEGGGKTVWGEPSAIGIVLEGLTFDVVLDYNGKDLDTVKPVVDWQVQDSFCSSEALVSWTNERPLEKELNAIIGAWFTLWRY